MRENFKVDAVENLLTAAAYAEEGEFDTARSIAEQSSSDLRKSFEEKLADLTSLCRKEGIEVKVEDSQLDAVAGIKTFLKTRTGIDKVVLSPAVTSDGYVSAKELNSLVRTASRPIVTMTRQACCAA